MQSRWGCSPLYDLEDQIIRVMMNQVTNTDQNMKGVVVLWLDVEMEDELQCEIYGLIKHLLDALVREGNPISEQDRWLLRSFS